MYMSQKDIHTIIDEVIREVVNQITPEKLTTIINNTISKWQHDNRMSIKEINDGYCMDFAEEIKNIIGYESPNGFHRVYSEYLYDYDDLGFNYPEQIFDDRNLLKWNKSAVMEYGGLPNINNIENYEPDTHVWFYLDGKNYDAENPKGVNKWYELDFYKRDLSQFKNK